MVNELRARERALEGLSEMRRGLEAMQSLTTMERGAVSRGREAEERMALREAEVLTGGTIVGANEPARKAALLLALHADEGWRDARAALLDAQSNAEDAKGQLERLKRGQRILELQILEAMGEMQMYRAAASLEALVFAH